MNRNILIWDLICYVAFPIGIWHLSRDIIGDYYAMLISTIPGFIYSIIRFILLKKINFFGIFLIVTLATSTLVDVLSGSAIQMLWNHVVYSYVIALIMIISILINRPIYLLFTVDIMELQGRSRRILKQEFYQKKILTIFKLITFGFACKDIIVASINVWLILQYGVDSFDKGILLKQIVGWGITLISVYGFFHIAKLLQYKSNKEMEQTL